MVHHAAEENGAFLREVRRGRRPRPRARREAFLLLLLPTPGSQIQTPQIAVRHALLHVPVVVVAVARVLAVPAVHKQKVAVRGDVRRAPRAGTHGLGPAAAAAAAAAAAGAVLPGHRVQRQLPHVVVVPDLVSGVVEPAEQQKALALGVRDHPVAAPRGRPAFVGQPLPLVGFEVEAPQVAVVMEPLLRRGRELAPVHVQVPAVRHRLVRAAGRRRVRRDRLGPPVARRVVPEEVPENDRPPLSIHHLAAEQHDLLRFLRQRGGPRAVTPR